jgi:hypothetical protein
MRSLRLCLSYEHDFDCQFPLSQELSADGRGDRSMRIKFHIDPHQMPIEIGALKIAVVNALALMPSHFGAGQT